MKIKICGITNYDDAAFAFDNGADFLGFIFYPRSPRYLLPDVARDIIRRLPSDAKTVGVFVNESNQTILQIADSCGLGAIQLHGDEPLEQLRQLTGYELIKAIRLANQAGFDDLRRFRDYLILIDTPSKQYGGSGKIGDWNLAKTAARSYSILLAGGLTPDNVAEAITQTRPYGVDVVSGTEKKKGIKDHGKVKAFIDNVRAVESRSLKNGSSSPGI